MCLCGLQGLRGLPGVAGPQGPAGHNVSPTTIQLNHFIQLHYWEFHAGVFLSALYCIMTFQFYSRLYLCILKLTLLPLPQNTGFTRKTRRQGITRRSCKYDHSNVRCRFNECSFSQVFILTVLFHLFYHNYILYKGENDHGPLTGLIPLHRVYF